MEQLSLVVSQNDLGYGIMKSAKRDRYVCFLDPCSGNTVKWSLSDLNTHRQKHHPSAGLVSCRRRGKQPTGKWPHKSEMAAEHARLRERGNLKRKLDKQENTYKRRLIKEAMATHGVQKEEDLTQEDLNDIEAAFAKYKGTRDERERATRSRIELALKLAEASNKPQGLQESSNSSQGEPIMLETGVKRPKQKDKELVVDADPIQIVIDPEKRRKPRSKRTSEERSPDGSLVLETPISTVHTNAVEAKFQQNALSVIEPHTEHDDNEEDECEILFSSSSELVSNNLQKRHKSKLQPHKSVGSISKAAARNHASDLQSTGTKSSSHGTLTLDLSKLETTALWRYWRHFNLADMNLNASKEQLVDVVEKHLISQAKEHHMELRQDLAEIKRALEDLVRVFRDVEVIKV